MRSRGGLVRRRVSDGKTAPWSNTSANEPITVDEPEQRGTARKRIRAQYRALYDELIEILFQLDPIGVHGTDAEKFVPEATTVMARLREARLADDVEQIIRQELRR